MKVAVQAEAQNKEGVSERQLVVADRPCWAELRYRPQYGQCEGSSECAVVRHRPGAAGRTLGQRRPPGGAWAGADRGRAVELVEVPHLTALAS